MIIGHIGVAFAASRRWPTIPLSALLLGTFAPDILREGFAIAGLGWRQTNLYSHGLPWSAILTVAAGFFAWRTLRSRTTGLVVAALVISHVALDLISGHKPLWVGGPVGLDVESLEQLGFVIESTLLVGGWLMIRQMQPRRRSAHGAVAVMLISFEAVYLLGTLSQRPYATRCLASPIGPCTEDSPLRMKWNATLGW